jgi:hypothetical protein
VADRAITPAAITPAPGSRWFRIGLPRVRTGGSWLMRWRVRLAFFCAAPMLLFAEPSARSLVAGGVVALAGLALRAWASGHIRKDVALAVSGPYAYTRHPLYLGNALLALGFALAANRLVIGAMTLVFLAIHWCVMRTESTTLARRFGDAYCRYATSVPAVLPRRAAPEGAAMRARFDRRLYLRNREYRAALGLLGAWILLAVQWLV